MVKYKVRMDLFNKKGGQVNNTQPNEESNGGQGFGSLLSSDKRGQQGAVSTDSVAKDVNSLTRRIRINEERSVNVRNKLQTIEHNMLINHKRLLGEIKFINEEISDIKREFSELKQKVLSFARELQESAKKEDIQVLERYINMWEPINFVTRHEVEKIIDEKLQNLQK